MLIFPFIVVICQIFSAANSLDSQATIERAFSSVTNVLTLYDEEFKDDSLAKFDELVNNLRRAQNKLVRTATVVDSVRKSRSEYSGAIDIVYTWCQQTLPILKSFLEQLDGDIIRKQSVIDVLDIGTEQMQAAMSKLDSSRDDLNEAIVKITNIQARASSEMAKT